MAKRMKLGEQGDQTDIISKAQELTTTHDTSKMVQLAEDLKRIAMDTTLSSYVRHRLYEECLRRFRTAQDKVIREGTSLVDTANLKEHWDHLRTLLREELQGHLASRDEREAHDQLSSAYTTPMSTPQPFAATPIAAGYSTPISPSNDDEDPAGIVTKILKEKGVQWQSGGRVIFPAPTKFPETSFKPSQNGYTSNNVQKAIDYLFHPQETAMPTRNGMDTIVFNVYFGLQKSRSLPGWIAHYPNLRNVDNQFHSLKSSRWS